MFLCCANKTKKTKKDRNQKNVQHFEETNKNLIIPTIMIDGEGKEDKDYVVELQSNGEILESSNVCKDDRICNGEVVVKKEGSEQKMDTSKNVNSSQIENKPEVKTTIIENISGASDCDTTTINHSDRIIQHSGAVAETINQFPENSDVPSKSCLSRHNSMHMSIKKKVNISSHAEIIEPEPVLHQFCDHASLGEDDEVFSDSLPPPKRDSMCAPYIEHDDEIPEAVAFAHGLPEWFNDERLYDIGCTEPPVTPVGRDELELRRQRLYTDLLRAAHAAVEHSVRYAQSSGKEPVMPVYNFNGRIGGDCIVDSKPAVVNNFENLVNRLDYLVNRLERSIGLSDIVSEKDRSSFDLETADLPPIPVEEEDLQPTFNTEQIQKSKHRRHKEKPKFVRKHIEDFQIPISNIHYDIQNNITDMSVLGYQDIVSGPLSQYLSLSLKIGGDVAKQAELVKKAFEAQLQYITLATQISQPSSEKQMELLKPTSDNISGIQDFREKNRASQFFNHLSAISESIPALGWVCVSPTPGPHVKEMNDAGQFYTNRVLKEWKEKNAVHVEWARAWIQTLVDLQAYIKQYHTTGLVWSGKGIATPVSKGAAPPPPPPPAFDLAAMTLDDGSNDERSALFAEINQGEGITKNLKRVTADMQTHKNPTLRTGPAPFKKPAQYGSTGMGTSTTQSVAKEPVFTRDGKKWLIEYQKNNTGLLVENAEMNNVVYMFKCEGSTLTVKGKVNNIVLDSCKKCSLLFDSVVASIEFVNCQSVQMQVLGYVPTISIDKTDGCQMYLSKDAANVEIISSKSSEMNVMLVEANGDYIELALPEQFKTTISGKTLKTVCVDSLG